MATSNASQRAGRPSLLLPRALVVVGMKRVPAAHCENSLLDMREGVWAAVENRTNPAKRRGWVGCGDLQQRR